jgi:hypothetical protein
MLHGTVGSTFGFRGVITGWRLGLVLTGAGSSGLLGIRRAV